MKIAVLSTSFSVGGAAIVTQHLVDGLRATGNEVKPFSLSGIRERRPSFLKERLEIFIGNGLNRRDLFKVSTATFGDSKIVDDLLQWRPDVVVLAWINQGMLSLKHVRRIGESGIPMVWVMHDMWNMTGICHYSQGCGRFEGECGYCPLIAKPLRCASDMSRRVWRRKRETYGRLPGLTFVAVSRWLADQASKSSLLGRRECPVIPNVFPLENYSIGKKEPGLIVFGAARLDNPIKGLDLAVDALNRLDPKSGAHVVFFGDIRTTEALERLRLPYKLAGALSTAEVADLCSRAQVMLSTAHYETLGMTLIEGQASGAVPVSFNRGGQVDIIEHMKTGWLAPFGDVESIACGIEWALSGVVAPEKLRESVARKFSAATVARAYVELFRRVKGEG